MDNRNVSLPQDAAAVQATEFAAPPVARKKRINRAKLQENIWGWIFVSALFIGTTVYFILFFIFTELFQS